MSRRRTSTDRRLKDARRTLRYLHGELAERESEITRQNLRQLEILDRLAELERRIAHLEDSAVVVDPLSALLR